MYACAIPTHENSAAVAGANGLKRVGGRRFGEGNMSASPHGRPGKDNATSADVTEKVSAGASEAPAIPDHEFRLEPDNTARDPRANKRRVK